MSKIRNFGMNGYKVVALQEFAFDRSDLQPEHEQWIIDARVTISGGTVWLVGSADSPGTSPYNVRLSERRAVAVRDAFGSSPRNDLTFVVDNIGERLAPPVGRDPASRTVYVIFRNPSPDPPPPPSIKNWFNPQPAKDFFIRTDRWHGVSVGVRGLTIAQSVMQLEISDGLWSSNYEIDIHELRAGDSGGIEIPGPGGTSARFMESIIPGSWGWFRIPTPKTVTEFGRKPVKIDIANRRMGFRTIFDQSVLHWPDFRVPDSVSFPLASATAGESRTLRIGRFARSTAQNLPVSTLNRLRQSMVSHQSAHTYGGDTFWTRN